MGEVSSIAWTHATFNPWIGCTKVSDGCKHCYAEVDTFARRSRANGLELWGADGARHVTSDAYWRGPLRWNNEAKAKGTRMRVFCASLADVFEDREDLREARARLWGLIGATPHLDWLLLTKRPEHAARLGAQAFLDANPSVTLTCELGSEVRAAFRRVWIGTTIENAKVDAERIPHLLRIPAAVRFLSCEPLLGPVVLGGYLGPRPHGVDWVIVGGESGPKARPMHVAWARSLVAECRTAGVACFVKQLGATPFGNEGAGWAASLTQNTKHWRWDDRDPNGKLHVYAQADKKGGDPGEWPEDLRVRQLPEVMS